jgi:Skp family chaperone for outer membrane proteins
MQQYNQNVKFQPENDKLQQLESELHNLKQKFEDGQWLAQHTSYEEDTGAWNYDSTANAVCDEIAEIKAEILKIETLIYV